MSIPWPLLISHSHTGQVDYKQKIPAGSTLLVTTELERLEGRKVWMRATVSDGQGTEFAGARALFVAPR